MAKRKEIGFVEKMRKFSRAGMPHPHSPNRNVGNLDELPTLDERIERIFKIIKHDNRPADYMIFIVMYDIESTKVRNQIAKYLLREGCTRVQKSIFLADLPLATYNRMRSELAQVQECYENQDSILIVPISTDYLQSMKIIGQNIDIDLILRNKNTLFF